MKNLIYNDNKSLISIIIPVYNESENIDLIYKKLTVLFEKALNDFDYEIIIINDGSSDLSWFKIKKIAENNQKVRAIDFSRNFGHQIALTAGYDAARGEAIVSIDADMQDSPSLIIDMVQKWKSGADIVYARRIERNDTFIKRFTADVYYRLLDKISDISIPRNVGDFRLIDKKVLQSISQSKEQFRYLRGMVAWTGFNCSYIDFKRSARLSGKTGYTWKKMFKLAFDGITSFSLFPLKLAAFVGIFVILSGSIFFLYITIDALLHLHEVYYPLFKWLVTIIYIFMGIQFLLLWLLGEYIGRIFEQQKGRPLYIINERVNFD